MCYFFYPSTPTHTIFRARTNFRGGASFFGPIFPVVRVSWKSYLCNVVLPAVYIAYMVEGEYGGVLIVGGMYNRVLISSRRELKL